VQNVTLIYLNSLKVKKCISGHGNCQFPDMVSEEWDTGTGLTGLRQEGEGCD